MTFHAFLSALFFLQAPTTLPATNPEETESQSLLDIILGSSTSGLIVIAILLILSIVAVYIIIERYATLTRAGKVDHNFMNRIRGSVESGNLQAAKALCQSVDAPMARMVEKGLDRIGKPLEDINKAIENVGNLICPAEYPLGEHANVVLVSLTEGEDKPLKYPVMFYEADCVVITKTDLSPYLKVNVEQLKANIRQICPNVPVFALSAETGDGLPDWLDWIQNQLTTPVISRRDEPVIVS